MSMLSYAPMTFPDASSCLSPVLSSAPSLISMFAVLIRMPSAALSVPAISIVPSGLIAKCLLMILSALSPIFPSMEA